MSIRDDQVDVGVDVLDHLVVVLGVVEQVDVGDKLHLARGGHVGGAGEDCDPYFGVSTISGRSPWFQ
jgi:hypothetical protein